MNFFIGQMAQNSIFRISISLRNEIIQRGKFNFSNQSKNTDRKKKKKKWEID